MLKTKLIVIAIALLLASTVVSLFLLADTSVNPLSYQYYYIQKFGSAAWSVTSIILVYIAYDYYKFNKEIEMFKDKALARYEGEKQALRQAIATAVAENKQSGLKCIFCHSDNVLSDDKYIYCLDCGRKFSIKTIRVKA